MELKTMKTQSPFSHLRGLKLAALAIGTSFVLAGCAGNPPTEQYAVTQSAVNSAVSAGGTEFAAVEMKQAQDKLKQAEMIKEKNNGHEFKRRLRSGVEIGAWYTKTNGNDITSPGTPSDPCRSPSTCQTTPPGATPDPACVSARYVDTNNNVLFFLAQIQNAANAAATLTGR